MGNNNTNTKLFIEAVLADMSGLSKELRKNLESVDTELPLNFDSEELEKGVLGALREAFRGLESSRFASQLDLSEFISAIFKQLQQGTVTNDKADFVYAFADSVKIFESFAERFGGDAKVVSQTIRELNESLTAQGIQDYLTNLKAVYKFVDNLELKPKDKDRLLASFTSSLGVGVDANGLGDALGLKKVLEDDAEKFKDVTKYAVSAKEARKRLIELLGGTEELKGWNDLLPGTKSRSDTARTRDIAGFISRIEALSGKEITAYLQDKIDDAKTDTTTKAQLEHLQKLYTEKGGWGEYYLKWSEKDNAGLQTLTQNNNLIVEMTKRQLEERQKVFEKYGKYNSSLLTKGQSPQATIEYDTKTEAAQANEELTIEEQTRRQIADQINQEAEELKKKLNVLKEISELQKQVVNSGVESTPEYQEMQYLQDVLDDVTLAVNNKTKAFEEERGVVHSVAKAEVKDLQDIQNKLDRIAGFNNEEEKVARISKPRQNLETQTDEQIKQAEEARKKAEEAAKASAEAVHKQSVLGEIRQKQGEQKPENKPKASAKLKGGKLPDTGVSNKKPDNDKTVNEREAQALKDIADFSQKATEGLQKFGDVNSKIAQNVTNVADALKKEASALTSMSKTFLKFDDSKIVQQARKEKLQENLSEVFDKMKLSKENTKKFEDSFIATIFDKGHLEDATAQLRNAYKDVVSFREVYSQDTSKESMLEMAKREAKLWSSYKEAEKQGILESNLEAKRLDPSLLGITREKNSNNIKLLMQELNQRKQVYENYAKEAESIQKEIDFIENSPTKQQFKDNEKVTKDYQEAIEIIKEYIEAQQTLVEVQKEASPETSQVLFTPEQLEQFNATIQNIITSIEKVESALSSLDDKADLSLILSQLESLNDILSNFIGSITFDDFKDIFTVTIDEAVDKVNEFKSSLDLDNTSNKFKEQISQMEEKIKELQSQLQGKDSIENKSIEAAFKPEQLEQLQLTFGQIKDSLNNIQTALGTLDDNSDIPSITKAVEEMVKVFEKLKLLIDDINDKKIKFGFSSNPDEKLIGEMNSEDVQNSLTKMFDDAIQKIQDFKTNVDMSETVKNFKSQMAEMEKAAKQQTKQIEKLEKALEKEKKARQDDKAKFKAKEEQKSQEAKKRAEEKARQEALRKEREEQERLTKEQEKEEEQRLQREKQRLQKEEQIRQQQLQRVEQERERIRQKFAGAKDQLNERKELKQQQEEEKRREALRERQEKIRQRFAERKNNSTQKSIPLTEEEQENRAQLAERWRALQLDEQQKQEEQNRKRAEQNKKNIQFELEQARLLEQAQNEYAKVQAKQQQEQIKQYEKQFYAWGEEDQTKGQLSFLSVIDQNTHDLDTEYKELIKEEQEHAREVAEKEAKNAPPVEIPIKGQLSFTTDEDIEQIGKTIQRDLLDDKAIHQIEQQYARLIKSSGYIRDDLNIEKTIHPFTEKNINSDSINELVGAGEEIKTVKTELASMFNSEGKIVGDPLRVKELLEQYTNLTTKVKELKAEISSPTSKENIALKTAKDAEKAEKELDNLKNKVDAFFAVRKKDTVESTVQSAIRNYGAINENGELRSIESPFFNDNKDLIQQQQYVISLSKALDEYRIAVDNLKKTRESDNIKLDDLKEANKQVELLENKINELDKAIKKIGKGNTNATDNQINGLKTKIQNILDKNTSLSTDATDKLKGYLDILNSGASISKSAYDSMSADIKQFSAEQTKSLTIWDLMTMKMREGIAFLATKFSFYQIFNQFRQGIEVIHQFDDALTEMMKVSDETRKTLEDYQKTTFDTADAIGTSALQLQNSTADFMRLGESLNEAAESAKVANVLMNVSEFQSIDEATKSLIAMSAAYDDLSKMNIIDKLNEVGNNYSISTSGAAEALQMSASALKTAGKKVA